MTAILGWNGRASALTRSLWDFYSFELYCTVRPDDGQPNRHRIEGIRSPTEFDAIRILLSIRQNERQEAGLVHELLHANLIPLGYPKLWINHDRDSDEWKLAEGITNNAEHQIMLPTFLLFGYSTDQFLGHSRLTTQRENRVITHIEKIAADIRSPKTYFKHVSTYLSDNGIKFLPIFLSDILFQRRLEFSQRQI